MNFTDGLHDTPCHMQIFYRLPRAYKYKQYSDLQLK